MIGVLVELSIHGDRLPSILGIQMKYLHAFGIHLRSQRLQTVDISLQVFLLLELGGVVVGLRLIECHLMEKLLIKLLHLLLLVLLLAVGTQPVGLGTLIHRYPVEVPEGRRVRQQQRGLSVLVQLIPLGRDLFNRGRVIRVLLREVIELLSTFRNTVSFPQLLIRELSGLRLVVCGPPPKSP